MRRRIKRTRSKCAHCYLLTLLIRKITIAKTELKTECVVKEEKIEMTIPVSVNR